MEFDNMLERFLTFFVKHQLNPNELSFLLACSGGKDSMCLAQLFLDAKIKFGIAHINHGTRNGGSDADADFVRAFAQKHELDYFEHRFNLEEATNASSESSQMVARKERYQFLNQIKTQEAYDYIATAHHQDDRVETFFINLSRASGLQGLSSIPVISENYVRPISWARVSEIKAYNSRHEVSHITDITNEKSIYERNEWRNNILPNIELWKPGFSDSVAKSVGYLTESERFIYNEIISWVNQHVQENEHVVYIDKEALMNHHSPEYLLFEILKKYDFNYAQCEDLLQSDQVGKKVESEDYVVRLERKKISILPRSEIRNEILPMEKNLHLPNCGTVEWGQVKDAKYTIELPENMDKTELYFRKWQVGDRFLPKGMKGKSKKLKKYFVDEKFSAKEKEDQWLLCYKDQIVWIVGKREAELDLSGDTVILSILD